ncbi:uncharacterized protein VTP21DRAFT_4378 [Calcarisporiella thermophila]|uniref:uncharacterized protein n=1 Tax=Calcarisporiella thermophila TaxID=911321 RepID=UPI003742E25D
MAFRFSDVIGLKTAMVLFSMSFLLGCFYSDWSVDYWILWAPTVTKEAIASAQTYYTGFYNAPKVHRLIILVDVVIGVIGLSLGLVEGLESNYLFDGACMALFLFAIAAHTTSVIPGVEVVAKATSSNEDVIQSLRLIAAAHAMMAIACTGIVFLQIGHYVGTKSAAAEAAAEEKARAASSASASPSGKKKRKDE